MSGWWFQIFVILIPIWGNDPIWLIFFKWVKATNQMYFYLVVGIKSHLKSMMFWRVQVQTFCSNPKGPSFSPTFFSQPLPPLFPCSPTFMWCFEGISFLVFTPHILGGNEPIFGQHLNTFQCWNSPPSLGFLFKAPEVFTKTRGALNPHCRCAVCAFEEPSSPTEPIGAASIPSSEEPKAEFHCLSLGFL